MAIDSIERCTFACGTRGAYVRGCRCAPCTAANAAYQADEAPDASAGLNIIGPGEIIDIRFTGVSNQYLIEIPQIGKVTVFAQNVGKSPVTELGAKVWVSWKVEHSFGLSDLPAEAQEGK
jgi:hypothetical protein